MKLPLALRRPFLEEIFTTGAKPVPETYVDRGQLDERLAAAERAGQHVAIHGESKHGKTWLRSKVLREESCARTQCEPGMTAAEALSSALGRMGVHERVKLTGTESKKSGGAAGARVGSRDKRLEVRGERIKEEATTVEERPVGQDAKDLGWVAQQFRERGRRPIFEDFHHLAAGEQKNMAFAIKALGDWDVPCVVAGIWPDQPLLTYYNGELEGRIEEIHLNWTGDELAEIVLKGCRALNVAISRPVRDELVRDAYTSAGLLQELAHELLREAGVRRRRLRQVRIDDEAIYRAARAKVAKRMAGRFDPFIDNLYNHGSEGLRSGIYGSVLWAVTRRLSDPDLLEGVPADALANELTIVDPGLTRKDLDPVLEGLADAHVDNDVHPAVLAHDRVRGRLVLVDRRFLLYRRWYSRRWPWD
jgi:hypothetical protein